MTTTDRPYRTIADKVQLFKENGLDVHAYYDRCSGPRQRIYLDGESVTRTDIERIASEAGIEILSMSLIYKYHSVQQRREPKPRWLVEFLYEPPPEFVCPVIRFADS